MASSKGVRVVSYPVGCINSVAGDDDGDRSEIVFMHAPVGVDAQLVGRHDLSSFGYSAGGSQPAAA